MNLKRYVSVGILGTALLAAAVAIPAFADTNTPPPNPSGWQGGQGMGHGPGMVGMMRPGVVGKVSAVNGDILTVAGRQGFGSTSVATTFTVDATNAVVKKNNATSTVSSIAVGDTVAVQGTVSGTNVTATMIRDGVGMMGGRRGPGGMGPRSATSTPPTSPVVGNGQPIVAGTVSAISGSTVTINNKSNVQYTIDASNAKILEGQNTIALSSVAVGDSVVVQGTVNGTSVTATTIIDQSHGSTSTPTSGGQHVGFFAGIGQFFMHLFGF